MAVHTNTNLTQQSIDLYRSHLLFFLNSIAKANDTGGHQSTNKRPLENPKSFQHASYETESSSTRLMFISPWLLPSCDQQTSVSKPIIGGWRGDGWRWAVERWEGKEEEAEKSRADGNINHHPLVIDKYLITQLLP